MWLIFRLQTGSSYFLLNLQVMMYRYCCTPPEIIIKSTGIRFVTSIEMKMSNLFSNLNINSKSHYHTYVIGFDNIMKLGYFIQIFTSQGCIHFFPQNLLRNQNVFLFLIFECQLALSLW